MLHRLLSLLSSSSSITGPLKLLSMHLLTVSHLRRCHNVIKASFRQTGRKSHELGPRTAAALRNRKWSKEAPLACSVFRRSTICPLVPPGEDSMSSLAIPVPVVAARFDLQGITRKHRAWQS